MKRVASVVGVVFLSSCGLIQPMRGSSRSLLTESGSTLVTELPQQDVAKALVAQFGKRGFSISERREVAKGDVVIKFKGHRTTIDTTDEGGGGSIRDVGSVFYALLSTYEGQTRVHLFGKPTFDNHEICSDEDTMAPVPVEECAPVVTGVNWPGRPRMTGREEAEVIESIALELEVVGMGQRPAGDHFAAVLEPAPKQPCTRKPGETPADALERCRRD